MWDNIKQSNICVIGESEGKEREETTLAVKIGEICPELIKDMKPNIKKLCEGLPWWRSG